MNKRNLKSPLMLFLIVLMIFSLMLFITSCGPSEEDVEENNEEIDTGDEEEQTDNNEDDGDTADEVDDSDDSADADDDSITREDIASLLSEQNKPDEYYYEQTITTGEYTSTQKFWFKGEKMRIEGEQDGVPYILIWTEDSMINLDPESKTAYRSIYIEDTDAEYADGPNDFGDTEDFDFENDESFNYLGEETINGEPCYVIESTFSEDNTLSKVWIHEEYGVIMRTEVTGDTEDMNAVMEVNNLKIGSVSDDQFTIPDDYEVLDY